MKKINYKIYRVHVDLYRPTFGKYHVYQNTYFPTTELRNRPSEGSYYVKAINEQNAKSLIRQKIGKFGSIDVIYDITEWVLNSTVGPFKIDLTNSGQRDYMYLKNVLKPETVIRYSDLSDIAKDFYGIKEENEE